MGRRLQSLIHDLAREARRRGRHDLAASISRFAFDGYDPRTDRGLADLLGEEIATATSRPKTLIVADGPIRTERLP